MNKLTLAYGDGGATLDAAAFPDYAQETLNHEVGAFEPLRLAVARLAEYEACGLDPSEVRRIAEAHQSSEIDAAVLDNGLLTAKERITIAKMIATAQSERLPAIKQLIQPLFKEKLDLIDVAKLILPEADETLDSADKIVKKAYDLVHKFGFKLKGKYLIDPKIFHDAWADEASRRLALTTLDSQGFLLRENRYTYTVRAYVNGKRARYIALRIPEQETAAHQPTEGTDAK